MAAAAEARTQTPIEGADASTLDKIEKAQRTDGRGEWWCVRLGTAVRQIRGGGGFWRVLVCFVSVIFLWHVNLCTSCDRAGGESSRIEDEF